MDGDIIKFKDEIVIKSLADLLYNSYRKATYDQYNNQQCGAGKRRSLIDLELLCKYYNLDYTKEDLDKIIRNVGSFIYYLEDKEGYYTSNSNTNRCFYCRDIGRRVISVDEIDSWTLENIKEAINEKD